MNSALWWLVLGLLLGWLIEWVIDWGYWRRPRQTHQIGAQEARQDTAEVAQIRDALASARADNQRLQAERNSATALAEQRQVKLDELGAQHALRADDTHHPIDTAAPRSSAVLSTDDAANTAGKATIQLSRDEVASFLPSADETASNERQPSSAQTLQEREVSQTAPPQRDPLIDINGIGPAYERKLFDAGVYTFENLAALTAEQVRAIIAPQSWQAIDPASWIDEARHFAQKKAEQ